MGEEALLLGFHEQGDLLEVADFEVLKIVLIAIFLEAGLDDHLIMPDAEKPSGKPPSPAGAIGISHDKPLSIA